MSKEGPVEFLVKKGLSKTWKKMSASVKDGKFVLSNPAGEAVLDIPVASAKVSSGSQGSHKFCVVIEDKGATHTISVASKEEADAWIAAFHVRPKLTIDDFDKLSVVGRGGFGKVQLFRQRETGQVYVIKQMSKVELAESDMLKRTILEKNVLLQMDHPFIVKARFAFQNTTDVFIGMDYVPGGELYERLRQVNRLSVDDMKLYVAQLSVAVGYLHAKGIVHRDLKPENVLFDKDGYIRITDFGLVKQLKDGPSKTFCGTPDYIAPEMIKGRDYGCPVDWWSIGCLGYEMIIGQPPFYNQDAHTVYRAAVMNPVTFPDSILVPDVARDFLLQLLTKDPHTRLGANGDIEEVKKHPFFAGLNWSDLEAKKIPMPWKPNVKSDVDVSQYDPVFTSQSTTRTWHDPSAVTASVQEQFSGFSCVAGDVMPEGQ